MKTVDGYTRTLNVLNKIRCLRPEIENPFGQGRLLEMFRTAHREVSNSAPDQPASRHGMQLLRYSQWIVGFYLCWIIR